MAVLLGEALDKIARMLRLHTHPDVSMLSGGAAIEVLATRGDPERFSLPHIMSRRYAHTVLHTYIHTMIMQCRVILIEVLPLQTRLYVFVLWSKNSCKENSGRYREQQ